MKLDTLYDRHLGTYDSIWICFFITNDKSFETYLAILQANAFLVTSQCTVCACSSSAKKEEVGGVTHGANYTWLHGIGLEKVFVVNGSVISPFFYTNRFRKHNHTFNRLSF